MKTHSWPDDHGYWPIKLYHYHGVRRGGLIFTGGQADLNSQGGVVNPNDLDKDAADYHLPIDRFPQGPNRYLQRWREWLLI